MRDEQLCTGHTKSTDKVERTTVKTNGNRRDVNERARERADVQRRWLNALRVDSYFFLLDVFGR